MSALTERMDKLAPRERKLLGALLVMVGLFVILVGPVWLFVSLASKRSDNQELRDLIVTIRDSKDKLSVQRAAYDALVAKYKAPAPSLAGYIEQVATSHGISVPESLDKPELPHGKRYTERLTVVKFHKVGMLAIAKTLEELENSGYPISISRLSIKPRAGEADSYEVELGVSAFDRKPDKVAASAAPAASAGADEASEEEETL